MGDFVARFTIYLITNMKPNTGPLSDVANVTLGVALAYFHPEYAAALMANLSPELLQSGKIAMDDLVEAVPINTSDE